MDLHPHHSHPGGPRAATHPPPGCSMGAILLLPPPATGSCRPAKEPGPGRLRHCRGCKGQRGAGTRCLSSIYGAARRAGSAALPPHCRLTLPRPRGAQSPCDTDTPPSTKHYGLDPTSQATPETSGSASATAPSTPMSHEPLCEGRALFHPRRETEARSSSSLRQHISSMASTNLRPSRRSCPLGWGPAPGWAHAPGPWGPGGTWSPPPPSSRWSETGKPRSPLLAKPPAGVRGGDREDPALPKAPRPIPAEVSWVGFSSSWDVTALAAVLLPQGWHWEGGSAPCPSRHTRQQPRPPALSHTLAGAFPSKPRGDPRHSGRTLLPPAPFTAASPSGETKFPLLPPGREGRSMVGASTCCRGLGCSTPRPRIPSPGTPTPLLPGVLAAPAPALPASPGSPSKPFLRQEELAKATGPAGKRLYSEAGDGGQRHPATSALPANAAGGFGGGKI